MTTYIARVHLVAVADDTGEVAELTDMTISGRELPTLSKRIQDLLVQSGAEPMHYPVDAANVTTDLQDGTVKKCSCGKPLSVCEEWTK